MKKYPVIYVILAGLSWGSAGLFIHFLSAFGFESSDFTMARCMVSAVVALILALLFHRKNLRVTARQLVPLVGSGLSFCAMAYFYYMGIKYSSAPTAAMILNLAPIIVMAFSVLFWKERFTLQKGLAVLGALVGCALVIGIADGMIFSPKGIIYSFISCAGYATYSIMVRTASKRQVETTTITVYNFLFASIVSLFLFHPLNLVEKATSVPFHAIIALVGFGAVTGFLASFFHSKGLEKLPAGVVASMASIEPMTITVTSVIFLGEQLTVAAVVGIILILASVTVLSLEKK